MAISLDSNTNSGALQAVSTVTFANTIANPNELLVVAIGARAALANKTNLVVTGVTYAGLAMTKLRADENDSDASFRSELWYLSGAPTGNNNVIVTWTGAVVYGAAVASSYIGVNPSNPIDSQSTAQGVALTLTASQTVTTPNVWMVDAVYSRSGTLTKDATQTLLAGVTIAVDDNVGSSYKGPIAVGSQSMTWTESNDGNDWVMSVAALKPAHNFTPKNVLKPRPFTPGIAR